MPLPGDQDVDLPRLVAIVSAPYTLLTAACHPLNVMKTRAQASSSTSVSLSRMEQLRVMLGTGGMRGLFSGVGPVLLGAIPARCSYIAALEAIKVPAERAARAMGADGSVASGFAHGAGGFAAAFVSSLVYVPVDVVSQRMMLEGASGSLAQTVREVTSGPRGWRGLYRGLGISLMLGLPAGSLWWATYGSVRTALADEAPSSRGREFAHKAIASTAAAAVVVSVMSPLDMIKTRVQLLTDSADSPFAIAARLIRRDGVASLYSGSMPRLVYLAVWSTMLITIYEEMKVYCVRPRDR
jgi:solute carrier family 25 protein 44